ncbi:MAG: hypothetical protein C4519_20105 [Desulfobacteraceae bacterium]|nr:MAG: hypothetical protein C4519_20105 [Desulfobacteraceae bacterium]
MDEESHKAEPLTGYPVAGITDGFSSIGRWLTMGKCALNDLINYSNLPAKEDATFWLKTAIIFITPVLNAARFDLAGVVNENNVKNFYVVPFIRQSKLPVKLENSFLISEDNPGTMSACYLANELLHNRSDVDRIILLAADSNIDPYSLWWLNARGQLKNSNNPTGLVPGEAAAAILLESERSAQRSDANRFAFINNFSKKFEKNYFYNDETQEHNTGIGLSESLIETLSAAQLNKPYTGTLYLDINGENWRSIEYSHAQIKTPKNLLDARALTVIVSAAIGDIGTANSLCNLCVAIESHRRHYSQYNVALITASSPYGYVGALLATLTQTN